MKKYSTQVACKMANFTGAVCSVAQNETISTERFCLIIKKGLSGPILGDETIEFSGRTMCRGGFGCKHRSFKACCVWTKYLERLVGNLMISSTCRVFLNRYYAMSVRRSPRNSSFFSANLHTKASKEPGDEATQYNAHCLDKLVEGAHQWHSQDFPIGGAIPPANDLTENHAH